MKPAPFSYKRPVTIAEAVEALADHGTDARIIAGGQSLGAMLNMRLVAPRVLVDINRIDGGARIDVSSSNIRVGATVRQNDVLNDKQFDRIPLLRRALPHVGHFQTRNRGTICGSIAHADPSAELPLALLVCGGSVELQSRRQKRTIGADEFFISVLTTARRDAEMITATHWPIARPGYGFFFDEFAIRSGDYAIVAAAAQIGLDASGRLASVRLGLAGVDERPILIDTAQLAGEQPGDKIADEIAQRARQSIKPPSDLQASAAYRTHLAGIFAKRAFSDAVAEARKRGGHA